MVPDKDHIAGLQLALADVKALAVMHRPSGLRTTSRVEQQAGYDAVQLVQGSLERLLAQAEGGAEPPAKRSWQEARAIDGAGLAALLGGGGTHPNQDCRDANAGGGDAPIR